MKRKILSLILCCALLFSLAACGKTSAIIRDPRRQGAGR